MFVGWLFDSPDSGKKGKKSPGGGKASIPPNIPLTEEEFNKFSPEEQKKNISVSPTTTRDARK